MAQKTRLDQHLLTLGLAPTRQQAQQLIRAGKVRDSSGLLLDKPGVQVKPDLAVRVEQPPRFVSRGGEKLLGALNAFPIPVEGRVCLDGGISTGGFTDCLLQHGASKVYGVDVGYGQTAWSLRTDPRVVLRERTNLRRLAPQDLYQPEDARPDLAVADVSFISLGLVMPAIKGLLSPHGSEALLLVKPQFEAGRREVSKGRGVIRDEEVRRRTLAEVIDHYAGLGCHLLGTCVSPITGGSGNVEFLVHLRGRG